MTLQMCETFLSNDANSLETHKTTIDQIIKTIIERGGDLRSHICWQQVNKEVLIHERRKQLVISRPGYSFVEDW